VALHGQKSRLGAAKASSPHELFYETSSSARLVLATCPSLFLIDPLTAIVEYKRAERTRSEMVFI
jgi:hypothetical protein